jgi:hypothetical protein
MEGVLTMVKVYKKAETLRKAYGLLILTMIFFLIFFLATPLGFYHLVYRPKWKNIKKMSWLNMIF